MNPEAAGGNDRGDLLDPDLARISDFERTSRNVPTIVNCKYDGFEDGAIKIVERAIDEYAEFGTRIRHSRCESGASP